MADAYVNRIPPERPAGWRRPTGSQVTKILRTLHYHPRAHRIKTIINLIASAQVTEYDVWYAQQLLQNLAGRSGVTRDQVISVILDYEREIRR
jgi:hypothetical protein